MKKTTIVLLFLCFTVFCFADSPSFVDLSFGTGHLSKGAGNYFNGTDTRDFNFQFAVKYVSKSGFGAYTGYTQDGVKFEKWLVKHNFATLNITESKRLHCLDFGVLYMLKGDKIDGYVATGATGYKNLKDEALGWFVIVGSDVRIYKNWFLTVKAQYRSHAKDLEAMQASGIETGILLTYRF